MPAPEPVPQSENRFGPLVAVIALCFIGVGLALQPFGSLVDGLARINISTTGLISDFFALGGLGAALANCGLVLLLELTFCRVLGISVRGPIMASMLMTAGFAFFGTNPVNALPLMAGVALYAKLAHKSQQDTATAALLCTALGPLVSFLAFGTVWFPLAGLLAGTTAGLLSGLVFVPLAAHFFQLNKGYSIYNAGFTAGMLALLWVSILRFAGLQVEGVSVIYGGADGALWALAIALCVLLIAYGLIISRGRLSGMMTLLRDSGKLPADFVNRHGRGAALFNMGITGLVALGYVAVVDAPMTGPVLGGVLGVISFAAYGKHPLNCLPVMLGCALMQWVCGVDMQGSGALIAVLYGTTLAPMAGEFGPVAGLFVGALHAAVVVNVFPVNGGINLYNNGFSGGLIAAAVVPIAEALRQKSGHRRDTAR